MEKTFSEYLASVRSVLTKNVWRFSPEQAARIVLGNIDELQTAYWSKIPSWNAAMEIGFSK